jgi:malyl-CoA/(S)-citramalyl-CoA lyase
MRTQRLQRSELAVPASSPRFVEKAAHCTADAIFLDLEDSVIPDLKPQARKNTIAALHDIDWGTRTVSVRVNGFETPWGFRDILEVAESCPRLDRILLPKCDGPSHIHAVELMLGSVEVGLARERRIGLEVLIETARGMANVKPIAATGTRLEALIFGAGDYQLDMQIFQRSVGAPSENYAVLTDPRTDGGRERHWNDPWHFALARVANACRANGLLPIDGPFTNIADSEGFLAAAWRAAALGFEGRWAIHPSQIDPANRVFSPSAALVDWVHDVRGALAKAGEEGHGAVRNKDGEMIDMAHLKMARAILERADRVAQREAGK